MLRHTITRDNCSICPRGKLAPSFFKYGPTSANVSFFLFFSFFSPSGVELGSYGPESAALSTRPPPRPQLALSLMFENYFSFFIGDQFQTSLEGMADYSGSSFAQINPTFLYLLYVGCLGNHILFSWPSFFC